MRFLRIILVLFLSIFTFTTCKTETPNKVKASEVTVSKTQKIAFHVSGMTCEIGCAKTIQSKLSKKKGITSAKILFKDSIGLVAFDANTISKEEITSFIDGIAGGGMYKVSNTKKVKSFEEALK